MANRSPHPFGTGGPGNGASRLMGASIVPAWRVRLHHPPANDNKLPLKRRLLRLALYLLIAAALASVLQPLLPL